MRTYNYIFIPVFLALGVGQADASPNQSTVVFDRGFFEIVDHHRLPQPKIKQIAKGIHIDPRLLRELQAAGKKKDL